MQEIWKDVIGYEDYLISNLGRIKTKSRPIRYVHSKTKQELTRVAEERFLKIYFNNSTGYKFVQLYCDKKSKNFTIHRLVATHFVENNNSLFDTVNHIDGNKHNNTFVNLEWCTNSYNHEHATKTGLKAKGDKINHAVLNDKCVIAIKKLLLEGKTHKYIADLFEVSRVNITHISNGLTWTHL